MSQRRTGGISAEKPAVEIVNEPVHNSSPGTSSNQQALDAASLSLDEPVDANEMEPLSVDGKYNHKNIKLKRWKESPFAVGLTEPTWVDERSRSRRKNDDTDGMPGDDTGCVCCSAIVCPIFNAGRVGNMAVLHSTTEWVEEVSTEDDVDEETGETSKTTAKRYTRPRLNIVVGPYWPMLLFVTYPLIFGTSWFAFKSLFLGATTKHPGLTFAWAFLTITLIVALACTGFRDPGILYRYEQPPPQYENSWRWNDQALTYRPRGAFFDSDTMVVVEEFDHTCPWTGTAIGKKNMRAFQMFVCMVFVCLTAHYEV